MNAALLELAYIRGFLIWKLLVRTWKNLASHHAGTGSCRELVWLVACRRLTSQRVWNLIFPNAKVKCDPTFCLPHRNGLSSLYLFSVQLQVYTEALVYRPPKGPLHLFSTLFIRHTGCLKLLQTTRLLKSLHCPYYKMFVSQTVVIFTWGCNANDLRWGVTITRLNLQLAIWDYFTFTHFE